MLVPDNCRVRKMGFSSASHLLRFHEWLWKRLASLIWLSMTLLFLWLWSFDRKLHVPLVRMNHAWFLWFLWNFYILLDAQMKVSDVHWFCVEVGSTLWFWMEPYIYIYPLISEGFLLCMRFCVCDFVYATHRSPAWFWRSLHSPCILDGPVILLLFFVGSLMAQLILCGACVSPWIWDGTWVCPWMCCMEPHSLDSDGTLHIKIY